MDYSAIEKIHWNSDPQRMSDRHWRRPFGARPGRNSHQGRARSAIATLWFINDEASATLVSEFYLQLRNPKQSKAQALQQAQQKLLADRVYEHPAYWLPFLLLNNWL